MIISLASRVTGEQQSPGALSTFWEGSIGPRAREVLSKGKTNRRPHPSGRRPAGRRRRARPARAELPRGPAEHGRPRGAGPSPRRPSRTRRSRDGDARGAASAPPGGPALGRARGAAPPATARLAVPGGALRAHALGDDRHRARGTPLPSHDPATPRLLRAAVRGAPLPRGPAAAPPPPRRAAPPAHAAPVLLRLAGPLLSPQGGLRGAPAPRPAPRVCAALQGLAPPRALAPPAAGGDGRAAALEDARLVLRRLAEVLPPRERRADAHPLRGGPSPRPPGSPPRRCPRPPAAPPPRVDRVAPLPPRGGRRAPRRAPLGGAAPEGLDPADPPEAREGGLRR